MKIEVVIDRLVLDGLPIDAAQAHTLRAALETQLAGLFAARIHPMPHAASVPSLRAAPVRFSSDTAQTGADIARSVHAALIPPQRATARSTR